MLCKNLVENDILNFSCDQCGLQTNNKKDFCKHLRTSKHGKLTRVNKQLTKNPQKSQRIHMFGL